MNWLSRWGRKEAVVDEILPREEVIPTPSSAPSPVCEQIALALKDKKLGPIARQANVTLNTMIRAQSGQGIKLETLEKIASVLGWTITVTDQHDTVLVSTQRDLPRLGE